MPFIEVNGKQIETDEDGFIVNLEDWNEEVALALAKTEQVEELTEDHWKVVNYLKDYYQEFGIAQWFVKLLKQLVSA